MEAIYALETSLNLSPEHRASCPGDVSRAYIASVFAVEQ
jgi:hypothetical protein